MRQRRAFTLIELLVVIAIIGSWRRCSSPHWVPLGSADGALSAPRISARSASPQWPMRMISADDFPHIDYSKGKRRGAGPATWSMTSAVLMTMGIGR